MSHRYASPFPLLYSHPSQTEDYVEYDRSGGLAGQRERAIARSRYEEDVAEHAGRKRQKSKRNEINMAAHSRYEEDDVEEHAERNAKKHADFFSASRYKESECAGCAQHQKKRREGPRVMASQRFD